MAAVWRLCARKQGTSWGGPVPLGFRSHTVSGSPEFPSYLASVLHTHPQCVCSGRVTPHSWTLTISALFSVLALAEHIKIPITALLLLLWIIHYSDVN